MKKVISYIFPIYNEVDNIKLLYSTLTKLLSKNLSYNYEIIFINDGSTDSSLKLLIGLQKNDSRVTILNFSRNFGHQIAVTAGLDHSRGDAVIIMDSDLQDPPSVSFDLINKWEEGYDVVYAQRISRKDTLFKRVTANIFYRVLKNMAEINIPRDTGDFRLLDRRVVAALSQFNEHNRFLRGLVAYVGFKQIAVPFHRDQRHAGTTGYPLAKMIKFAADGITGFSLAPLRFIRHTGLFIAGLSFAGILYALLVRLVFPEVVVAGWTFIVISILFVGGIQLIMLSVLGSYIGRTYTESQNRPLYIIENVYRRSGQNEEKNQSRS